MNVESGGGGPDQDTADNVSTVTQNIQHQHSLDSQQTSRCQVESSQFDVEHVLAEPLEKILEHKLVLEKRQEMEKKLESLRKKHDKQKMKIAAQKLTSMDSGGSGSGKKTKFAITNKLVKRLSSKSLDPTMNVPPCPCDIGDSSEDSGGGGGAVAAASGGGGNAAAAAASAGTDAESLPYVRTQYERLLQSCREYSAQYKEIGEKYHESIYAIAEKVLKTSQASQLKQLRASLDKVTHEVMHQLQEARRNEVKNLATRHRDRDELVRIKREVATSVVERGVAERVRLTQTYEKRAEELQKQHDAVRAALTDHRAKARQIIQKDAESRTCVASNSFLVLFNCNANLIAMSSTEITGINLNANASDVNFISPAKGAANNSVVSFKIGR